MNTTFILSIISKYANAAKQISQDSFLDLTDGLTQEEVVQVLDILSANGYTLVDESVNKTFYYSAEDITGLTNEQLCIMAQQGSQEAKDALFLNNERLIRKIANRVQNQFNTSCMDQDDLFMEGCIGMINAIEKYDHSLDNKFSTYAVWWIRQAVTRAVMDQGYMIRIPVHMFDKVIKVNNCRKVFQTRTMTELQYHLNADFGMDMKLEDVETLVSYADKYLRTASLNTIINDSEGGDTELMDFIAADNSLENEVMQDALSEEICKALCTLTEREHAVISMRYGLEGNTPMTLEQVGKVYNLTRERIRQIENKAIKKLGKPGTRKHMEGLLYA